MVFAVGFEPAKEFPTLKFDENYVLWHQTPSPQWSGVVTIDGVHWCPQRRIYPVEKLLEELKMCRFKIITRQVDVQKPGEPDMLRVVAQKSSAPKAD